MQASMHRTSFSHEVGAQLAEDLRFFLFKLGASRFGVPLDHVRSVAPMPTGFMGYGAGTENHFVFQDSPLIYVSLWDELGLKSRYSDCDELLEMLPQRLKDHVSWMDALESSIQTGAPFTKARDPHECAFGKWYYGYKTNDSRLSLLLREFEKPHATIHALADQLLGLVEAGRIPEAKRAFESAKGATLPVLQKLFNDTIQRLLDMRRRIVIITTDGVDAWALGADDALGVVDVAFERVTQFASRSPGLKSKAASALVTLEDHSVVPLLDWSKFCVGDMV
jgi:chemotaxis signal transduction protein